MPFYALIEPATGDIVDVVRWIEGPLPEGLMAIELPERGDDLRIWLRERQKKAGGAGADTMYLEREEDEGSGRGGSKAETKDGDVFFARLEVELVRTEQSGRHLGLLLFEIAAVDRPTAQEFVVKTLEKGRQEMLPCDLIARVRDHLVIVMMPDIDAHELEVSPERGAVTPLTYPRDRESFELIRRRKHPLLRRPLYRP